MDWHLAALPRATQRALRVLAGAKWLSRSSWYLACGTALALQAGHRKSLDLDFFTQEKDFVLNDLIKRVSKENWATDIAREGTVYGRLEGAKVSFIAYPFFVPQDKPLWYENVRVLTIRDIAVMKIVAISQRGRKRDFIDLYWYATHEEPLLDVIRRLPKQYPTVAHNYHHILKSLVYFDDAENDPWPEIYFKTDWKTVKQYFRREIPRITKELLRL
ncbi:MAG: hypothetical protein A3D65_04845 [Candidatus Lloydbacteria bacterium RIFCSPHIGHO2_02_FULL_50_13]|uniref:Nucleotidyl transferase AbiEii/AbiGii toxin family protein n=1 Tax=Candidatus Lloydbacteria bacterium RIFCSPHIGHO2_02_FULL_50_13 TaxID=1798661 RepID=A0A1G2D4N8_9BACT|nr:MAG: hypothetical protein A3D65_04845 [Candidatus Lloydbacteria bacterium RIFCSPHIGHO2_02_FULL_50_13]